MSPTVCRTALASLFLLAGVAAADEPVRLATVVDPGPNQIDEPVAKEFSLSQAAKFLDSAALTWQKQRQCFTCHTNYAYLYARPSIGGEAPAHAEVRAYAEELVSKRWVEKGPRWDAEVVASAAALAFNDAATTGQLHPLTRAALDRMWTVQREDGGWTWIKCDWPPMESDDDYGAGLAAVAVSVAPENYHGGEAAKAGIARLQQYLEKNPPPTLHHAAMLLWATSYGTEFLSPEQARDTQEKLWKLQQDDGGWSLSSLGNWQREDKSPQDTKSDGYGTGFVAYVLHRSGVPADDPRLQKAVTWLKTNQRASGRWITRSLHKDSKHFISHCGTAFAVLAIAECKKSGK